VLRSGNGLIELQRSSQPASAGTHRFVVGPARYVVEVLDGQRQTLSRRPVQVLWETLRVNA
jgi:hypothetical protein